MTAGERKAITNEVQVALDYLLTGLRFLRTEFTEQSSSYHITMFALAQGFERLIKMGYYLWYYEKTNTFPKRVEMKRIFGKSGHSISESWHWLRKEMSRDTKKYREVFEHDMDILERMTEFPRFINFLDRFAQTKQNSSTRYYNFDYLSPEFNKRTRSPYSILKIFFKRYREGIPDWFREVSHGTSDARSAVVIEAERADYARVVREHILLAMQMIALCYTVGIFGDTAKRLTKGYFDRILQLIDGQVINNLELDFC